MLTNPRSDRVRSVRALSRRSMRRRTGRLLVEGPQGVREAVRHAPGTVDDLYVTPDAVARHPELVAEADAGALRRHDVSEEVLAAMCDADSPQGMVAVCTWQPATLEQVLSRAPRCVVLLHAVRDPGNLGTVIRGVDAAGADAVLVSEASVDVTSPKVVRSTVGSLFHVPVVTDLPTLPTIAALRDAGLATHAADGSAETSVDDAELAGPHAWVMGNEARGLPDEVAAACDDVLRVPIHGLAESLNLAMATTLCVYASARAQVRARAEG